MQRRWAPAALFSMLHLALWTVVAAWFASTQTPAANSIRIAPSNPMLQFSGLYRGLVVQVATPVVKQ